MSDRRWEKNAGELRARGFKRDDVRAVRELYGIGAHTAVQALIDSKVEAGAIERQRSLRGGSRVSAAKKTILSYNTEVMTLINDHLTRST